MAHTRTWNASYEASPAAGDSISEGDDKIRNLKTDVRERIATDHYMDVAGTDADHGEHSKVTLRVGSAPTEAANKGILYAKDVSAKAELHYIDEDGNEVQLTDAGAAAGIDIASPGEIGGTTPAAITGTTITANTAVASDTVSEKTGAAGVTVDTLLIKDGVIVPTDGQGIDFSAFSSGSSDVNVLDDYEEGTFNVTLTCGSGTITMNSSFDSLAYTKIGRICHVQGSIRADSVSSPSGELTLNGLPFTVNSLTEQQGASGFCIPFDNLNAVTLGVVGYTVGGSTTVIIREQTTTQISTAADHIKATSTLYFNFSFIV